MTPSTLRETDEHSMRKNRYHIEMEDLSRFPLDRSTDCQDWEEVSHEELNQILDQVSGISGNFLKSSFMAVFNAMYATVNITTNHEMVNNLLSTGGMSGMLNTIWLIMCAMTVIWMEPWCGSYSECG